MSSHRILHLLPYLPSPIHFGGALRIHHILRHFVDHHEVRVVAFGDLGDREAFLRDFPELEGRCDILTRPAWRRRTRISQLHSLMLRHSNWYTGTFTPQMQEVLERVQEAERFDIVQFEFPMLGQYAFDRQAIRVMDAHNVEYDAMRRMSTVPGDPVRRWFYRTESRKIRHEELEIASRQDALFVTSRRDARLFAKDLPDLPTVVIPNGVDSSFYPFRPGLRRADAGKAGQAPNSSNPSPPAAASRPFGIPEVRPHRMVFTGMMGYVPNYDGMLHFLEQSMPIIRARFPDAEVHVVGKNPPRALRERSGGGVTVTGFVEDVRPYVYASGVYIVPLRMGGGTRLKVLEALSAGIPVVTTPIGCEGIDVEDGVHVLIREDPEAFAGAVIDLMTDPDLGRRLIENGRRLIEEVYDWRHIGARMDAAFRELLLNRLEKESIGRPERIDQPSPNGRMPAVSANPASTSDLPNP